MPRAFKKIAIWFSLFLAVFFFFALSRLDVSTRHRALENPKPVALVSYASGDVFLKNRQILQLSAADKGFDAIYNYDPKSLDRDFYEKREKILRRKTGAGYWLWKPYLILKTLKSLPEGAILLYLDSATLIDKPLDKLLKLTDSFDLITAGASKPLPLRRHLKKEALKYFDFRVDDAILDKEYVWGYFILLKNTPEIRKFIEKWLDICSVEGALTDDEFDPKNQEAGFRWHTHDQSLLAVLMAKYPERKTVIKKNVLRKKFGIVHHHRHQHLADRSLLLKIARVPEWLDGLLWNNLLFRKIRTVLFD